MRSLLTPDGWAVLESLPVPEVAGDGPPPQPIDPRPRHERDQERRG